MGRPKPLLPFGDRTAIELVVATLATAGLTEIIIVLGPTGTEVARVLAGSPVEVVWNSAQGSDMAASLRLGLTRLAPEATGVLVFLADYPLVGTAAVRTLLEGHRAEPSAILLPSHNDRSGHPVLLPLPVARELEVLPTLRDVIRRDPGRVRRLAVSDPAIAMDIDTPEDYQRALAIWQAAALRSGTTATKIPIPSWE